jgi:hypothetical protein
MVSGAAGCYSLEVYLALEGGNTGTILICAATSLITGISGSQIQLLLEREGLGSRESC